MNAAGISASDLGELIASDCFATANLPMSLRRLAAAFVGFAH